MDIVYLVMRFLCLFVGILGGFLYILTQAFRRLPAPGFALKTLDWFTYVLVAMCLGLGANSYWGLLGFVPLVVVKWIAQVWVTKERVRGAGRWMEVEWQRFTPRGFQFPKEAMDQLGKLPGNQHFLIPRFVSLWMLGYFLKNVKGQRAKAGPVQMKPQHEQQALDLIEAKVRGIRELRVSATERVSLPFGELKVTRL